MGGRGIKERQERKGQRAAAGGDDGKRRKRGEGRKETKREAGAPYQLQNWPITF